MHKDDLEVWNKIMQTLNRSDCVTIQSPKRKRAMQAIDKLVQAALAVGMKEKEKE
jgi:hypothetical protein